MAPHSRINTDVKPVREIDIENASQDELIEYLCQTIHYEVEKGEDADCDLIRECSDWLAELTTDKIVFTPEELATRLEAIKNGKDTDNAKPHKPCYITHVTKRKVFARVTILVASLVLLSFLSLSVMAMHAGYDSTWEYISVNVKKLFGLKPGQEITEDGISVIKNTGMITYDNIDEFLEAESLEILYPRVLPDSIRITDIHYIQKNENKITLCFILSNTEIVFNVSNYNLIDVSSIDTYECITINNFSFYYTQKQENVHYAILQYDGFEYTIQAPTYDSLIQIMNNMKG